MAGQYGHKAIQQKLVIGIEDFEMTIEDFEMTIDDFEMKLRAKVSVGIKRKLN